jgi:outer membrane lipoprotein-sorting protein
MKIKLIAIFLLISSAAAGQQDEKAEKVLDKIAEKNQSGKATIAEFTLEYKNLQSKDNSTTSKGKIIMKDEKYKLDIRNSVVYYNGKTMWNHLTDVNEVNISEPVTKPGEQDILNHPNQIFTIYKKDFKYKFMGTETDEKNEIIEIDLYPKNLEKDYSRIKLKVNQDSYKIHSAKVYGKDGSRITLKVDTIQYGQQVSDSVFAFDKSKHPDAEIIDMRF